jgi:tRNA(fMet)-specific endonuclease VapC
MPEVLLDTDILSEILKGVDANVAGRARPYLGVHSRFTFSLITKYQVLRGLHRKAAAIQQQLFLFICAGARIVAIDDLVIEHAARLWAHAIANGKPAEDADLLIAATALEHGLPLCTGNTTHFDWIPGLRLVNWRMP